MDQARNRRVKLGPRSIWPSLGLCIHINSNTQTHTHTCLHSFTIKKILFLFLRKGCKANQITRENSSSSTH